MDDKSKLPEWPVLDAYKVAAERDAGRLDTARELLTEFKRVLHLICQDNRIHMNSSHIALGMKVERWLDAVRAEKGEK